MKYGAPMLAVKTPAGISKGENKVRPIKSATITSMPPSKAEVGSNTPKLEPTSLLAMCGAINPTNPIPPAKAVEPPIKAVLIINNVNRCFWTCPPSPVARSSPSSCKLIFLAYRKAINRNRIVHGANTAILFQVEVDTDPVIQRFAWLA